MFFCPKLRIRRAASGLGAEGLGGETCQGHLCFVPDGREALWMLCVLVCGCCRPLGMSRELIVCFHERERKIS